MFDGEIAIWVLENLVRTEEELQHLKKLVVSMAERIHGQSQLLSRRAEKRDESGYQG